MLFRYIFITGFRKGGFFSVRDFLSIDFTSTFSTKTDFEGINGVVTRFINKKSVDELFFLRPHKFGYVIS